MSEKTIPIPARLKNVSIGGYVAGAIDIYDDNKGKTQQTINSEVSDAIDAEVSRAEYAEENLRSLYEAMIEPDIIVGALPAEGVENTIYRVPDTDEWHDYIWDGTQFVQMATYDNAIDDVPTAESNNLVKSGGVEIGLQRHAIPTCTISNQFNPLYVRYDKAINNDGEIVNFTSEIAVTTKYYLLPSDCKKVLLSGHSVTQGNYCKATLSKTASDDSDKMFLGSFAENASYDVTPYISTYPYICVYIYRDALGETIDFSECGVYFIGSNEQELNVSMLNVSGGTLPTYQSLSSAIAAIPSVLKEGGLRIKFLNADNKYEHYILKTPAWSADNDDWIWLEDEIKNVDAIESRITGGVFFADNGGDKMFNLGYVSYSDGELTGNGYYTSDFIGVKTGDVINIKDYASTAVALISSYSSALEGSYLIGKSLSGDGQSAGNVRSFTVPEGVDFIRMSCYQASLASFTATITRGIGIEATLSSACSDIEDINVELDGNTTIYTNTLLSNTGYITYNTGKLGGEGYKTSDFIAVQEGDVLNVTLYASPSVALIAAYSSTLESSYVKASSVKGSNTTGSTVTYTVPNGVNYIRLCCASASLSLWSASLSHIGINDKIDEINSTILAYNRGVNFIQSSNLLVKSRCSISFSFDDSLAQDAQVKAVFDEFGYKCGFAIITGSSRYFDYAREGFEILAHGETALSSADEATIRAAMIAGKKVVTDLGLICHGWVTPSSSLPSTLRYVTNDYFEYGYTVYKGNDTTGQTMASTLKSYNLWRCHMNTMMDSNNYISILSDAVNNNGMIAVYGHSREITQEGYWTLDDLRTLLQYCKDNNIEVLTPYQSCLKLYETRHND